MQELEQRSRPLVERSGLSLADLDWVYWNVTQDATTAEPADTETIKPSSIDMPDFEWLQRETLWRPEDLQELIDAISGSSPQIVLAGPPGTSKTWVAKALAAYLTGGEEDGWRWFSSIRATRTSSSWKDSDRWFEQGASPSSPFSELC